MARTVVKEVTCGRGKCVLYDDGSIRMDDIRASYPHLTVPYSQVDPKTGKAGTPKFSMVGIAPKATHRAAKDLVKAEIERLMKEKKWPAMKAENKFLRDGDLSGKEEYLGAFTINASETSRPALRNAKKENLSEAEADALFYAGCRVNLLFRPWVQDNTYGKKINSNLLAVQFFRDDDPIGEGRISQEDVDDSFDSVDDDGDGGFGDDNDDDMGGL